MITLQRLVPALAIAAAYFAAGRLGLALATVNPSASAVWPPTGIAVAALLLGGRGLWPVILAASFLVNWTSAAGAAAALAIAAGNTAEALLGAWLVERLAAGARAVESGRGVVVFAASAALGAALAASVGSATLVASGLAAPGDAVAVWVTWWLGDLSGAVVVGPPILLAARPRGAVAAGRGAESVLLALALAAVVLLAFGLPSAGPVPFLCLPVVLWAAFRFGARGAAACSLALAAAGVPATIFGFGPFAAGDTNASLLLLEAFLSVLAVCSLAVAAVVSEREHGRATLVASEARYQAISEAVPAFLFTNGASGECDWVSPHFHTFTGAEPGAALGAGWSSFVHPEDREGARESFEAALRNGAPHDVELRFRRADGRYRWFRVRNVPSVDAAGRICRWSGISIEVHERREAEERLHRLIESAWDAVLVLGADARILYASPSTARILGRRPEDLVGTSCLDLVHPEDAERTRQALASVTARPEDVASADVRFRHRDGTFREIETTGRNLLDDPAIGGIVVNFRDVTERRRIESELRAGAVRLQAILDHCPAAVFVKDLEGRYLMMNAGGRQLFRQLGHDVPIGRRMDEIFPPGVVQTLRANDVAALRMGGPVEREETVGDLTFLSIKFPLYDGAGRASAVAGVSVEITDRKRAERERERVLDRTERARLEAEAANRAKDEFLAMLAHELRNPLGAVRNALVASRLDPSTRERALEIAFRQTDQLARLVDDLLDVARVREGKIALRKERFALRDAVVRAVDATRPQLEARGHAPPRVVADEGLEVEADLARVEQVVANLLGNAAKFTPPGRAIEVFVERRGEEAVLRVVDQGEGVPGTLLPRIFEPFVQGERALDRAEGGLGVGLTLVQRIAELHGGRAEARSAGPGRGTEVSVRLPAAPAAAETGSGAAPMPAAGARAVRVVVVEDNADSAESLATLLAVLGHSVEVRGDAVSGLELARREVPDLMLVDIGLPGMNGYELARRVRADARLRGVFLTALTGYGYAEDKRRSAEAGFDEHLVKPVDLERLEAVLRAAAARAAAGSGADRLAARQTE